MRNGIGMQPETVDTYKIVGFSDFILKALCNNFWKNTIVTKLSSYELVNRSLVTALPTLILCIFTLCIYR